jgi:hypothetical protein
MDSLCLILNALTDAYDRRITRLEQRLGSQRRLVQDAYARFTTIGLGHASPLAQAFREEDWP